MGSADMNMENLLIEADDLDVFFNRQTDMSYQLEYVGEDNGIAENTSGRTDRHFDMTDVEEMYTDDGSTSGPSTEIEDEHHKVIEALCRIYHVFDDDEYEIKSSILDGTSNTVHITPLSDQTMYCTDHQDGRAINEMPVSQCHKKEKFEKESFISTPCLPEYNDKVQRRTPCDYTITRPLLIRTVKYLGSATSHQASDSVLGKACIYLCNSDLWSEFHNVTTEMIVSRHGRCMFPVLDFRFTNLSPTKMYFVFIDMHLVDSHYWKFKDGKWISFCSDVQQPKVGKIYLDHNSPNTGAYWMKEGVSFNRLKLTNSKRNVRGHINLSSMQKYQPRVHVIEVGQHRAYEPETLQTKSFEETQFISVTAYQNPKVKQLKINKNPYASGFRDMKYGKRQLKKATCLRRCQYEHNHVLESNVYQGKSPSGNSYIANSENAANAQNEFPTYENNFAAINGFPNYSLQRNINSHPPIYQNCGSSFSAVNSPRNLENHYVWPSTIAFDQYPGYQEGNQCINRYQNYWNQ